MASILITRDELLAKEKLKTERVDLPNGRYVFVRQMTAREKDRFEQSLMEEITGADGKVEYKRNLSDFRSKLCVNTVCDKDGNNLLKPTDIGMLSKNMSAFTIERIVKQSQKLNKITDEDRDKMVKNSEGTQSGDSTSD